MPPPGAATESLPGTGTALSHGGRTRQWHSGVLKPLLDGASERSVPGIKGGQGGVRSEALELTHDPHPSPHPHGCSPAPPPHWARSSQAVLGEQSEFSGTADRSDCPGAAGGRQESLPILAGPGKAYGVGCRGWERLEGCGHHWVFVIWLFLTLNLPLLCRRQGGE